MPRSYKLLTGLIALAGSSTLLITGEVNPVYYPFVFLMTYGYMRLLRNRPQGSRVVIGLSSIGGLFIFLLDAFVITGDYLVSVGHLTLIFHGIKSFDIKEPYDPFQVYFMALLQLVVASEFTTQMLFGVIIIVFIVLFIFVMIMAHYIKALNQFSNQLPPLPLRSIISLVLVTLLLSTLFFVSLPRLKYGIWGTSHVKGIKNAGFTERMDLSSGELKLDPTVVMRVELRPFIKGPYYWRGMTLDYFDGKVWSNSFFEKRRSLKKEGEAFLLEEEKDGLIEQDILLEPVDSDVLFLMDRPVSIKLMAQRLERDFSDTVYLPKKGARRLHYIVKSNLEVLSQTAPASRYLQVPDALRDKLRSFTEKVISEKKVFSETEKAILIESFLKKNYSYSLRVSEPPQGVDPLSYFLFVEKKGYCEHYASAMALMLRSIGIPSRIVTGFSGGQINDIGNYIIIRQKDAHSWVEAFIDGRWRRFDPTPPETLREPGPPRIFLYLDYLKLKWQRYVVSFSSEDQRRLIGGLENLALSLRLVTERAITLAEKTLKKSYRLILKSSSFFLLLGAGLILIFLILRIGVLRRGTEREVSRYYMKLKKSLGPEETLKDSSTAGEFLEWGLRAGLPEKELREFISIYESARFGNRKPDMERYRVLYKKLKKSKQDMHPSRLQTIA